VVGRGVAVPAAADADLVDRRPACGGVDVVEERAVLHVLVDRSLSF
jgi:hypothetical protein